MPTASDSGRAPLVSSLQGGFNDIDAVEVEGSSGPIPVEGSPLRTPPPSPVTPAGSEAMQAFLAGFWPDPFERMEAKSASAEDVENAEVELEPLPFSATTPTREQRAAWHTTLSATAAVTRANPLPAPAILPAPPPLVAPADPASLVAIPDDEDFHGLSALGLTLPAATPVTVVSPPDSTLPPVADVSPPVPPFAAAFSLPIRPAPHAATTFQFSFPIPLAPHGMATGTFSFPAQSRNAPPHAFFMGSEAERLMGRFGRSTVQLEQFVEGWREGFVPPVIGRRTGREEMEDGLETEGEERATRRRRIEVEEEKDDDDREGGA